MQTVHGQRPHSVQAPIVQKVDTCSPIHWINLYPVNSAIGFPYTYPLDSDFQRLNNRGQKDTLSNEDVLKTKLFTVILTRPSLKTIILMGGTYPLRPNNGATTTPSPSPSGQTRNFPRDDFFLTRKANSIYLLYFFNFQPLANLARSTNIIDQTESFSFV